MTLFECHKLSGGDHINHVRRSVAGSQMVREVSFLLYGGVLVSSLQYTARWSGGRRS